MKRSENILRLCRATGNALWRGLTMTEDDCLRRDVIKTLICHFQLSYQPIEQRYGIRFADYFAEDFELLAPFEQDGLVERNETGLRVTPVGAYSFVIFVCVSISIYVNKRASSNSHV